MNSTLSVLNRLVVLGILAGAVPAVAQLSVNSFSFPNATRGFNYGPHQLTATGGLVSWSLPSGSSLPPGLGLDSSGIVSGTVGAGTALGLYTFTARASLVVSNASVFADRIFTILVVNPLTLAPAPSVSSLPVGIVDQTYPTTQLTATGGTGTGYTFAMFPQVVNSGAQTPPGLTLSASGVLSGTPTLEGNYPVRIQVNDSGSGVGNGNYDILITRFDCPQSYADLGQPYSSDVALNPFAATSYSIIAGQLPPGLTLNTSSGVVSGTTNTAGIFTYTLRVTDGQSRQLTKGCSITPQSDLQTSSARTTARVGVPYRSFIGAIGGQSGYSHSIISGTLPDGLGLEASTGRISGTPTTPGPVLTRIRTQDSFGVINDLDLTIFVLARDFQPLLRCSLPTVAGGQLYSSGLSLNSALNATYSISGSLPPGLSLNPTTGHISGTASSLGSYSFTAIATGATSQPLTASCSISVADSNTPSVRLACPDQNDMLVGEFYASPAIGSGGKRPYTYSLYQSSLPPGLSLDPNSGLISGTLTSLPPSFSPAPSTSGGPNFATQNFFYSLRVTDAGGFSTITSSSCINTVSDTPLLSIITTSIPNAQLGSTYAAAIEVAGGLSPYTASFTGSLPSALSLSVVGTQVRITGIVQQSGSFPVRLIVRDSSGQQAFRNYTITVTVVDPLRLISSVLNGATVGVNYSSGIEAAGGSPPYRFSITGGALPPGISLAPDGNLRGSPTTSGTFRFDIEVADIVGSRVGRSLSIAVFQGNFRLGCPSLQAELGVPYNSQANVLGGSQPYSFYLAGGQLPPGLSLDEITGTISGRATTAGAFIFTFGVRDARQAQTQTSCSIGVLGGALRILTEGPIQTKAAEPYQGQLDAAGGQAPYQWTLINAAPEAGIAVAPNGSFTGKTTQRGTFSVTVQARDAVGATATRVLSIASADSTLTLACPSATRFQLGVNALGQFVMTGGQAPYRLSLFSGSLPQGFDLSTSGAFSVRALQAGTFSAQFQAVDETNTAVTTRCTFEVTGEPFIITTDVLPAGRVGTAYSSGLSSRGGVGVVRYSLTSGGLPAGLDFDSSTGSISGTPEQEGAFNLGISATDEVQRRASKTLSLNIETGTLPFRITTGSPLSDGLVGRSYSESFAAAGGKAPYVFSISGAPAGLTATGDSLSGTPTAAGQFTIDVSARDASGATASKSLLLRVKADGLFILTDSLPDGVEGQPYSISVIREGGRAPFSWSIVSGAIPPGVEFNPSSGNFEGSPSRSGVYATSVVVTDATGATARRSYSFEVRPTGVDRLSITTASLPNGNAGITYPTSIGATGGRAPYAWAVSGDLPPGLSFSSDGAISGTPQAIGTSNFQVTVTDSLGLRASRVFSLTIGTASVPALSIESLPDTTTANQTLPLTLRMASAFGVPVSGRLTLSFVPDSIHGTDDPAIRFSNGSRTLDFTIPAGSTTVSIAGNASITTGTLAGTIRIDSVLNFAGASVPGPTRSIVIRRAVPVITTLTLTRSGAGLEIRIDGATNTRQLTEARVTFTASGSVDLTTASQITVNVSAAIQSWFASAASQPFGGRFALTLPFTVSGDISGITGVSVIITNGEGASAAANAN